MCVQPSQPVLLFVSCILGHLAMFAMTPWFRFEKVLFPKLIYKQWAGLDYCHELLSSLQKSSSSSAGMLCGW